MLTERRRIGDILTRRGVITKQQLDEALELQRLTPAPLGSILAHLGYVDEDSLNAVLSDEYSVQSWNLRQVPPDPLAVEKLPADIAKTYKVLPVAIEGDTMQLAMSNPEDVEALDVVRYTTKLNVVPVLTARHRLLQMIDRFHGDRILPMNASALDSPGRRIPNAQGDAKVSETVAGTVPIISLVNDTIRDAIRGGATDIYLEPVGDKLEIRFRTEGIMRKVSEVPIAFQQPMTMRLKILAGIDIVENFVPVDGRIVTRVDERKVELRLSIMPAQRGNRMLLRVLDRMSALRNLEDLGFEADAYKLYNSLVSRPYGLFLITGPSGSGKTTTLYATASHLSGPSVNVMTSEDPIEFEVEGLSQSQVNDLAGLTMEKQVAALMRQDPDVIVIGEIRDDQAASIAARASMTGHMVISTMQSNNASSAVARLTNLGIEAGVLATSLCGVSAQRLMRTLCPQCKGCRPLSEEEKHIFEVHRVAAPSQLARGQGCESCRGTGFAGRAAIHEVMPVTPEVSALIAEGASAAKIGDAAKSAGYVTMQERALALVARGNVAIEDARRMVALDPDYGTYTKLAR